MAVDVYGVTAQMRFNHSTVDRKLQQELAPSYHEGDGGPGGCGLTTFDFGKVGKENAEANI
jgi:hypothetical protein